MITVIHVITRLELGGAQENTLSTCQGLAARGLDVELWFGPGGILDADARALPGVRARPFPTLVRELHPVADTRGFLALQRAFRDALAAHVAAGRPRESFIVHTHSSKAGILGRLAARSAGVERVVHGIHGFGFHEGQDPVRHALFLGAERRAGRVTDAFVSVSRASLAEARAKGIVAADQRAVVVRSGFDLDAFRREAAEGPRLRAALVRELGLEPDAELVVSIANLKPQKDPLTLLRAAALLRARRPKVHVLFAGDGELRGEVEAERARLGLERSFHLLGWRRDVAALLGAADVVALSSIFEGLPRSAVQAVVARRPCVATRVDGTPEIIADGRNGYLVEPRDPARMADALERALVHRPVDPDDVARVAAWDERVMVAAQAELYDELVRAPAPLKAR